MNVRAGSRNIFCGAEVEIRDKNGEPIDHPCKDCDVLPPGWGYHLRTDGVYEFEYTGLDPDGRIGAGLPPKIFNVCINPYILERDYEWRICGMYCEQDPTSGRFHHDGECHCQQIGKLHLTCGESGVPISNTKFNLGEIYPNPGSNSVNLPVQMKDGGEVLLEVTDITGRVVISQTERLTTGAYNLTISVADLPIGSYVLRLVTQGTQLAKALNVQH